MSKFAAFIWSFGAGVWSISALIDFATGYTHQGYFDVLIAVVSAYLAFTFIRDAK